MKITGVVNIITIVFAITWAIFGPSFNIVHLVLYFISCYMLVHAKVVDDGRKVKHMLSNDILTVYYKQDYCNNMSTTVLKFKI